MAQARARAALGRRCDATYRCAAGFLFARLAAGSHHFDRASVRCSMRQTSATDPEETYAAPISPPVAAGAALADRLRQGVFSNHRQHLAKIHPGTLCRQGRAGQPRRQEFCRLPAQWPRRHYRRSLFGGCTARVGVSMPVAWAQLPELKGGAQWTVVAARDHLSFRKQNPGAGTSNRARRWPVR